MIARSFLLATLAAVILFSSLGSSPSVQADSSFGWVEVLSDPYYTGSLQECNPTGATTTWCIKNWHCPLKEGFCQIIANQPGITIKNSKTVTKSIPTIAFISALQGCNPALECSKGFSNEFGFNIPAVKLQQSSEITIEVSKLDLAGPNSSILTDLFFIDEKRKVILVMDIYWARNQFSYPVLSENWDKKDALGPVYVGNETFGNVGSTYYHIYHFWPQPSCLTNSDKVQRCTVSVSDLLKKASGATYRVAKCLPFPLTEKKLDECATNDWRKGTGNADGFNLDYSNFVFMDTDSGIELLFAPWGEATATITYTQLRYWSKEVPSTTVQPPIPQKQEEKEILTISPDKPAFNQGELVTLYGFTTITGKGVPVDIRVFGPKGSIYADITSIDTIPETDGKFTASFTVFDATPGIYTIEARYFGLMATASFLVKVEESKLPPVRVSVGTENPSYNVDEIVRGRIYISPVVEGSSVIMTILNPASEVYNTIFLPAEPDGRIDFHFGLDRNKSFRGTWTIQVEYEGSSDFVNFYLEEVIIGEDADRRERGANIQVLAKQIRDIIFVRVRNVAGTEPISKIIFTLPESTLVAYKGPSRWEKTSSIENAVTFHTLIDPIGTGEKATFLLKVDLRKPLILWQAYDIDGNLLNKGNLKPLVMS